MFGWRFHGAVTDMLIFFKSLSLCVFVFKSTDCAFADDSREAETGTGRVGCVFDSFNFFQNLFSPSPFSFGARDERDRGRGRSSICGGAIDLDGARSRFRAVCIEGETSSFCFSDSRVFYRSLCRRSRGKKHTDVFFSSIAREQLRRIGRRRL